MINTNTGIVCGYKITEEEYEKIRERFEEFDEWDDWQYFFHKIPSRRETMVIFGEWIICRDPNEDSWCIPMSECCKIKNNENPERMRIFWDFAKKVREEKIFEYNPPQNWYVNYQY